MIVTKELIAKGALGTAAVAAAAGTTYLYRDQIFGSSGTATILPASEEKKITKFDQGLIDFLDAEGKINFKVTLTGATAITLESFPNFTTARENKIITAEVEIATEARENQKIESKTTAQDGDPGKIETLKKLNNNNSWTWKCEVKFTKKDGANQNDLNEKEKLINNSDPKGFFNKLKGDGEKELKKRFIKNCSETRGDARNKAIDALENLSQTSSTTISSANILDSSKEFSLRDKKDGEEGETENKLYFEDKGGFNKWFETTSTVS